MMSLCPTCGVVVRVVGDAGAIDMLVGERSGFWPNGYVCPVCERVAVGVPTDRETPEMLSGRPGETLFELTPEEAFALHSGLGLPNERKCTVDNVATTLKEGVVRWGLATDLSSRRVYLEWLETAGGTRLYLGAGPMGAIVFRVRPKHSYVEKVIDGT